MKGWIGDVLSSVCSGERVFVEATTKTSKQGSSGSLLSVFHFVSKAHSKISRPDIILLLPTDQNTPTVKLIIHSTIYLSSSLAAIVSNIDIHMSR
jgi:hypothetical protein